MIRINLLAEAKPVKKKRGISAVGGAGRLNTMLLAGAIGLALLVGLVHYLILSAAIRDQDDKIRIANIEKTRLEAVLKEVKDFEAKKTRVQRKIDLINQLKQNQRGPVRLMDEVSKALPDLVWLDRMECRGNSVSVAGKAFNPPAVANFLENLKRVPSFQEPKVDFSACGGGAGAALYCFHTSFVFSNIDKTQPSSEAPKTTAALPAGSPAAGGM